jgi:NAD(P) transhydrogenase subunit alpha
MRIGIPKEVRDGEQRVALTDDAAGKLVAAGHTVVVEQGAGIAAGCADAAYEAAGATVTSQVGDVFSCDAVLKVQRPVIESGRDEIELLGSSTTLIGMLSPLADSDTAQKLANAGVTSFALELVPRISRAQSMDVLSSMATVAGYRAVLIAAGQLPRFFPLLMTAAGTIPPAKVLVVGAGVAGLQAIATARRLGAVVSAYDTRAVVKEQVESLGASFLDLDIGAGDAEGAGGYAKELSEDAQQRQRDAMADHVAKMDVIVTTALIPGRPAPRIITTPMVERMRAGSVIVDLASENGGNVEPSVHAQTVDHAGVTIVGPDNLPSGMAVHASQLYSKNLVNFLTHLIGEDNGWNLDFEDEITAGACLTREGSIVNDAAKQLVGAGS